MGHCPRLCKNKFRYPLHLKYHDIAQGNEAVISALTQSLSCSRQSKTKNTLRVCSHTTNKISSTQTDLRIIFNDTKNNPELFKKWLELKAVDNVSELDIDAIEEYIIKNSGEELVYTCEDEVTTHNRVLTFLLQKASNGATNGGVNTSNVIDNTSGDNGPDMVTLQMVILKI